MALFTLDLLTGNEYLFTDNFLSNIIPKTIEYTTDVLLTNYTYIIISGKTLTSNDIFTVASGVTEGCRAILELVANGINSPILTAFTKWTGSESWNVTNGKINLITFFRLNGINYYNINYLN